MVDHVRQQDSSAVGQLYVEHVPLADTVVFGQLDANNAAYVLEQLRRSADYAMSGKVSVWRQRQCKSRSLTMPVFISVVIPSFIKSLQAF